MIKAGAKIILTTIFTGITTWFWSIAKSDIPNLKTQVLINQTKIDHNVDGINSIQDDLKALREGQNEILRLLIQTKK